MSDVIVVAIVGAIASITTTVITAILQARASSRHSAKQSIFQMILEDHVAVQEGHLPTNYQNVLDEYDIYHSKGGNSYVTQKVEEYRKWFVEVERKKIEELKK